MTFGRALRTARDNLVPSAGNERRYAAGIFLDSIGDGLFLTGTTVFALRAVGLSAQQVGIALSAAGIAGFLGASTFGTVADRFGARRTMTTLCVADAVALLLYVVAGSFPVFTVVACVASATAFGKGPASSALVSTITSGERRVRLRAQVRSGNNLGFTVGALLAGVALAVGTRLAYEAMPVVDALTVLAEALVIRTLPELRASTGPAAARRSFTALRNGPFLLTTALNAMLCLHATLITTVVPLWLVGPMAGPAPLVSVLLTINTVLVVLFQVRLSAGASTLGRSIRMFRWAAAVLLAGCVVIGLSAGLPTLPGVVLVAVGVALLSAGEMVQSGASWGMYYELAPQQAHAEYLAGLEMSLAAQAIVGPAFGTWLVLSFGLVGWTVLGVLLLVSALVIGPAARWTARRVDRLYPSGPGAVVPEVEFPEAA